MIIILDFGSQYTQLIARRVRESGVYCEIQPINLPPDKITRKKPAGLILSGSPARVNGDKAPVCDPGIFRLSIPVLGICYGLQLMVHRLGGEVVSAPAREYGEAELTIERESALFLNLNNPLTVWMSHGDRVESLPGGFESIGHTNHSPYAAIEHPRLRLYGVQFHPEVVHTPRGKEILENFVLNICGAKPDWTMKSFIRKETERIREKIGKNKAILALSGGVDSSVTATLTLRAIGDQIICVFVDNGLLPLGERKRVEKIFQKRDGFNLICRDARERFLDKLKGVVDPEEKRRIIGREFIAIFEEEAGKIRGVTHLVQGTLYPDVIESTSVHGPSARIKTHHNVGGLPQQMNLKLIEPLKYLFKDEVRKLGRELGLPEEIISRQPFPGPGLAVRIIGEVTAERLETLRRADALVSEEIRKANLYEKIWQSFAILLPLKTVGVMGDERTYENIIALRCVDSLDGMTADWSRIPNELLAKISNRIINEIPGINRVVYDISSKPPATIEWE